MVDIAVGAVEVGTVVVVVEEGTAEGDIAAVVVFGWDSAVEEGTAEVGTVVVVVEQGTAEEDIAVVVVVEWGTAVEEGIGAAVVVEWGTAVEEDIAVVEMGIVDVERNYFDL